MQLRFKPPEVTATNPTKAVVNAIVTGETIENNDVVAKASKATIDTSVQQQNISNRTFFVNYWLGVGVTLVALAMQTAANNAGSNPNTLTKAHNLELLCGFSMLIAGAKLWKARNAYLQSGLHSQCSVTTKKANELMMFVIPIMYTLGALAIAGRNHPTIPIVAALALSTFTYRQRRQGAQQRENHVLNI